MTPDAYRLAQEHGGIWCSHPDFPVEDWRAEVLQGQTTLGYWDLTLARLIEAGEERVLESDDRIEKSTRDLARRYGGIRGEHPGYPRADWEYEVAVKDTVKGYWEWVEGQIEQDPQSKDWSPGMGASSKINQQKNCLKQVWRGVRSPLLERLDVFFEFAQEWLDQLGLKPGKPRVVRYEDEEAVKVGWVVDIRHGGRPTLGEIQSFVEVTDELFIRLAVGVQIEGDVGFDLVSQSEFYKCDRYTTDPLRLVEDANFPDDRLLTVLEKRVGGRVGPKGWTPGIK